MRLKYLLLLIIISCLTASCLMAQNAEDRKIIRLNTNIEALEKIAERTSRRYSELLQKSRENNLKTEILDSQNRKCYVAGFDAEGNPVYDSDDNLNAAITSGAAKIWQGGNSGLDLDGSGVEIGHWEAGGLALPTHQELAGKITHAEEWNITGHASHTACTMIGSGINDAARGMASGATIISRQSDDDESEIALFGGDGGILSNHSYSSSVPYFIINFGRYINSSKEWDEILYNAPYLTSCKSAGNDRDDYKNPGDFGYDLIHSVGASKNLITVGAIDDVLNYTGPESIIQSSFSNWGPTDDWRIKPDITANGVILFSADNNSNYAYNAISGTSMSTASVTGTVALLQQHFHNENTVYMKAATVKALLIGTALEAGENDGPDFQSGWGLINAVGAAEVISHNGTLSRIDELSLSNGDSYTTTIEVDGTSPLSLTIAWTDPTIELELSGILDDPTPTLVNDLDVRITGDSSTYYPWLLTPNENTNNFTDAATKGDNFRDNVERVDVSDLPPGVYTVTVSHKNELVNGFQGFSMVINGLWDNVLGLNHEHISEETISLYPNPTKSGLVNISIPDIPNLDNYLLKVFDLRGSLLKQSVHSDQEVRLALPNITPGTYIIQIQTKQTMYSQLLLIEN